MIDKMSKTGVITSDNEEPVATVLNNKDAKSTSSPIKIQVNSRDIGHDLEDQFARDQMPDVNARNENPEVDDQSASIDSCENKETINKKDEPNTNEGDDKNEVLSPSRSDVIVDSSYRLSTHSTNSNGIGSNNNNQNHHSQPTSTANVSPGSESTSSSKAPFSPFSSRKETSESGSSSSSRSFFLAKSRLADVDGGESNSGSGCNIKVTLKPSVLKVQDSNEDTTPSSSHATNGNAFSLFGGKDSAGKFGSETGPIRFTPLNSVFKSKSIANDTEKNKNDDTESKDAVNLFLDKAQNGTKLNENISTFSTFAVSSSSSTSSTTTSTSGGFVFGQNLEERVTNVAKDDDIKKDEPVIATSLVESSPNVGEKRKYENITGEEDELNVMQVFCKLYQWDPPTSGWKEKGKGNLRLNDRFTDGKTCSRLIMRTSGSYKLILNCLLVHGMKFELANDCLRFSTVDGIQLIKGKTSELEQVRLAVDKRLRDLPKRAKSVPDSDSTSICNGTGASSTDNETHNIAQSCVTSTATITTSSSSSATSSTSTSAVSTSDTQ